MDAWATAWTSLTEASELTRRTTAAAALLVSPPPSKAEGVTPYEVVYRSNKMRLLHYAPNRDDRDERARVPILIVYALVNRYYILDLEPESSVVARFLENGLDVYLLDWGAPSALDARVTLDDYVNHYLDACVDEVRARTGAQRVPILGYCQGGTLATLYAALHPEKVANLVVMAAPLAYDCDRGLLSFWTHASAFWARDLTAAFGTVPGEALDPAFVLLKPVLNTIGKFWLLQEHVDDPAFVETFFRMETWIRDAVPQAGAAYEQFVEEVYRENHLVTQGLRLGDRVARLPDVRAPVLMFLAEFDHIVPPGESFHALAELRGAHSELILMPTGHVGLSVGRRAHEVAWPIIARWVREHDGVPPSPPKSIKEIGDLVCGDEQPLHARGIVTLAEFAREDPVRLSRLMNAPVERTRDWVEEARVLVEMPTVTPEAKTGTVGNPATV